MNVAMTATDSKKTLLVRFCLAYKGVLKDHTIFCTAGIGNRIKSETNLDVVCLMHSYQGGLQQLASKISWNEIDLVIYIKDFISNNMNIENDKYDLGRLCDIYSIPIATNIPTAEALILSLSRGDLNWRIFSNSSLNKT